MFVVLRFVIVSQNMDSKLIIQTAIYVFFVSIQPIQTKIFVYQSALLTFEEARYYCQNEFEGGDLAIIKEKDSVDAVVKFLVENRRKFEGEGKKLY